MSADCRRCGIEHDDLIVAPAGDDVCWPCLRDDERSLIRKTA